MSIAFFTHLIYNETNILKGVSKWNKQKKELKN